MNKVHLLFCIHNHQPAGNFDSVIEDVYKKSYLPFLEVLERFPEVKIGFHCSGVLFEWFEEHHPEYFNLIQRLIKSKQIELLTGGYYEPIFPMIPDRDKVEQIKIFSSYIRRKFSCSPKGLWLPERVWEPGLSVSFAKAKVKYTLVDDYHFNSAGLFGEELLGYYLTEDNMEKLAVFPINKKLRYLIPFSTIDVIFSELRKIYDTVKNPIIVFGDDGEKFGAWPETFASVYGEKWLERFFQRLTENTDWIEMLHFSEALERFPAKGRIYLPAASYSEMMEWSLPAKVIPEYKKILDIINRDDNINKELNFIRGSMWRNFLVKYPESNLMQKKACYVSSKVPTTTPESLKKDLFRGECNCAYWHGVFGGIYLPHLRHSNYSNLIKAEYNADIKRIKNKKAWLKKRVFDFDCDGYDEVILENSGMNLYISPAYGGSIFELDIKGIKNINLMNTISRKEEGYHLLEKEKLQDISVNTDTSLEPEIIKQPSKKDNYFVPDWYLRRSFIDHILSLDSDVNKFAGMSFWEMGDFIKEPYSFSVKKSRDFYRVKQKRIGTLFVPIGKLPWAIDKTIDFHVNNRKLSMLITVNNISDSQFSCIYGSEFNFSIPDSSGSEKFIYRNNNRLQIAGLQAIGVEHSLNEFGLKNNELDINFITDKEVNLWFFPIETFSRSEEGFDRIYQETCILINKRIDLNPGDSWKMKLDLEIKIFKEE
ncbi:MAG: DUF1926 domain-containing protein [bacterium]|nr:DUF1926 domain-containing protein [bacterium]